MADEKNVQVNPDKLIEPKEEKKEFDIPFPVKVTLTAGAVIAGGALVAWAICSGKGKQISEVAEVAKEVIPEVTEEAVKAAI